jgi:GNAT superfamily N-acetyltransferase
MGDECSLRRAAVSDLETIVTFTVAEAREAEEVELERAVVRRGVEAGLRDPSVSTYWVAESSDGEVIASISAVREWSNFNGGYYWWIQSLFIEPVHRGSGLVDLLLDKVAEEARASGAIDLRLYAHGANRRALEAYHRCGFSEAPYVIMLRSLEPD